MNAASARESQKHTNAKPCSRLCEQQLIPLIDSFFTTFADAACLWQGRAYYATIAKLVTIRSFFLVCVISTGISLDHASLPGAKWFVSGFVLSKNHRLRGFALVQISPLTGNHLQTSVGQVQISGFNFEQPNHRNSHRPSDPAVVCCLHALLPSWKP